MLTRGFVILTLIAGGVVLVASAAGPSRPLKADAFNSSEDCGECHAEIFGLWRGSVHASAVSDPIFEAAYDRAYRETAGAARELCLRCHAPVAYLTDDLELKNKVSREGITCDYCHSITAVDLKRQGHPFDVKLDGVKRGPLGDADSPAHGVEESALHQQAEFCAGCHEYANDDGLLIFSTYSEWKLSPQAEQGQTCQSCHMPVTRGQTVVPELGVRRTEINLHNISGGHSSEQVRKAATVRIRELRRSQPTLARVEVVVSNVGSGHYIPTGIPTRKLLLEVDLYADSRHIKTFRQTFQRVLLDSRGRQIEEDHRVILDAKVLMSDNRIRPGESRVVQFSGAVPENGRLDAEARLRYIYEPQILSRTQMSILMASDKTLP